MRLSPLLQFELSTHRAITLSLSSHLVSLSLVTCVILPALLFEIKKSLISIKKIQCFCYYIIHITSAVPGGILVVLGQSLK